MAPASLLPPPKPFSVGRPEMSNYDHLADPPFDPAAITLKKKPAEPEPATDAPTTSERVAPDMPEETMDELKDKIKRLEEECFRMKQRYETEAACLSGGEELKGSEQEGRE